MCLGGGGGKQILENFKSSVEVKKTNFEISSRGVISVSGSK